MSEQGPPIPKLPRGRGTRVFWADIFRIGFLLIMLFAIISLKDSCSSGVANFVESFSPPDAAPPAPPPPGYEILTPERVKELFPPDDAGPA